VISFNANKTFLASYLLDDYSDGTMELLKGEQLEHIKVQLFERRVFNVRNLVASFKHHLGVGYMIASLN
jgi:hypothetical protein